MAWRVSGEVEGGWVLSYSKTCHMGSCLAEPWAVPYIGWELGIGAEWAAEIWSATGQSAGSCHHLTEFAKLKRKTTFTFKVSIDYWLFLMLKLCSKSHLLMNLDCLWPFVCLVLSCAKPRCSLNLGLYILGAQRLESFIRKDKICCRYFDDSGCLSLFH